MTPSGRELTLEVTEVYLMTFKIRISFCIEHLFCECDNFIQINERTVFSEIKYRFVNLQMSYITLNDCPFKNKKITRGFPTLIN